MAVETIELTEAIWKTAKRLEGGANAITKRVFHLENRIERSANVKFIEEYISRVDEMIERKIKLFS